MNTLKISHSRISPGMLAALIAGAMIVIGAVTLIAHADTVPTITNAIQNGSNTTITTAPIGTAVHDVTTVASTTNSTMPTGTVDFSVYANTSCDGTPTTQSGVTLVNGAATSSNTTVPATGLGYKVHYSGDASTTAATSACQALTATAASVSVSTALSASTVLAGSSVNDTATLNNETSNATGTVTYTAYTNNLCTNGAQSAGVKTVASGVVPNSDALVFNTPGTYFWQAVYSGDQNNSSATSVCTSEPLVVQATSTPATTPGTINGNVYNDANGNDVKDGSETGLSGWTIWLHLGTKKDGYNNPVVMTATTDANGNYSFANLALGKYFVEEQVQTGWKQTSNDVKVVLGASSTGATVNFANIMKSGTTTGIGHGKGTGHPDGDNDADDNGTATSTSKGHGFGQFFGDFIKSHFSNGHDNGNHFGQLKNINSGKDNDNDD